MTKYLISMILCLTACGSSDHQMPPAKVNTTFRATTQPAVLGDTIDFSALQLNKTQAANDLINCDGSFGNNGSVNGVASGNVRTTGTAYKGTIQFGNVAYQGATDSRCHDISKEAYSYELSGQEITICLVNPAYPYCTTYTFSIPAL